MAFATCYTFMLCITTQGKLIGSPFSSPYSPTLSFSTAADGEEPTTPGGQCSCSVTCVCVSMCVRAHASVCTHAFEVYVCVQSDLDISSKGTSIVSFWCTFTHYQQSLVFSSTLPIPSFRLASPSLLLHSTDLGSSEYTLIYYSLYLPEILLFGSLSNGKSLNCTTSKVVLQR